MFPHLYTQALLRDPVLAEMIKEALDDGKIDEATAALAWRVIWQGRHAIVRSYQ